MGKGCRRYGEGLFELNKGINNLNGYNYWKKKKYE